MTNPPRLMTAAEAGEELGLTEYTVRAEHRRGVLPGRKPGRFLRFTAEDLDTYEDRIRSDAESASGLTPASRRRRNPRKAV